MCFAPCWTFFKLKVCSWTQKWEMCKQSVNLKHMHRTNGFCSNACTIMSHESTRKTTLTGLPVRKQQHQQITTKNPRKFQTHSFHHFIYVETFRYFFVAPFHFFPPECWMLVMACRLFVCNFTVRLSNKRISRSTHTHTHKRKHEKLESCTRTHT